MESIPNLLRRIADQLETEGQGLTKVKKQKNSSKKVSSSKHIQQIIKQKLYGITDPHKGK